MTEFNYREAYASVASATAHEAMERRGALDSSIKPVRRGMKVLGPAFTCVCPRTSSAVIRV